MSEMCVCGNWIIQQTAWTEANAGRRFITCSNRRCNLSFRWLDEPLCGRAKIIIPGLLRRVNRLEAEKTELELKAQTSKGKNGAFCCTWPMIFLLLTWFVIIAYIIGKKDEGMINYVSDE